MNKLKIKKCAAFSHNLERNGSNHVLLSLVKELSSETAFEIFSPSEGPLRNEYEGAGIKVNVLTLEEKNYHDHLKSMLGKFDFAIINTIIRAEAVAAVAEIGMKHLWLIHETWPIETLDHMMGKIWKWSWPNRETILEAFDKCHNAIYPAHATESCYANILPSEKSMVIYNGLDLKDLDTYRSAACGKDVRKRLGIKDSDFVFLHMGAVNQRKGQKISVSAVSDLISENKGSNVKLLIVGARRIRSHEIEYLESLEKQIRDSGVAPFVKVLPVQKDTWPYYLASDAVVCPSFSEVLPMVLLEAMAFERPVIASNIDGIPEAVDDKTEGFLIEPGNATALARSMQALMDDPGLVSRMGSSGRKRLVRQFGFRRMINEYYNAMVKEILNDTHSGPVRGDLR